VIPDGLPTLSTGSHTPGSGQACVMEFVSVIAGQEWSDTPDCTNLTLCYAAQRVNDTMSDDERHLLVPLVPDLIGTNPDDWSLRVAANKALMIHLIDRYPQYAAQAFGEHPSHTKEEILNYTASSERATVKRVATEAVKIACLILNSGSCRCCTTGYMSGAQKAEFLRDLIAAYNQFVGRNPEDRETVTGEQVGRAVQVVGQPIIWPTLSPVPVPEYINL
jgi:hypothetical protein